MRISLIDNCFYGATTFFQKRHSCAHLRGTITGNIIHNDDAIVINSSTPPDRTPSIYMKDNELVINGLMLVDIKSIDSKRISKIKKILEKKTLLDRIKKYLGVK